MTKVITANRLRDGEVVYFTVSRQWDGDIARAVPVTTPEHEVQLMTSAAQSVKANAVVDVAVVDLDPSGAVPQRLRERIRANGPTIHPQFARVRSAVAA